MLTEQEEVDSENVVTELRGFCATWVDDLDKLSSVPDLIDAIVNVELGQPLARVVRQFRSAVLSKFDGMLESEIHLWPTHQNLIESVLERVNALIEVQAMDGAQDFNARLVVNIVIQMATVAHTAVVDQNTLHNEFDNPATRPNVKTRQWRWSAAL